MTEFERTIPHCSPDCRAAHTIKVAMHYLGVGKTKLYELMNEGSIAFIDAGYGRRIRHDEIDRFLSDAANASERIRKNPAA